MGCRWANNNETCPRGEKCQWAWARDEARGPPQVFGRRIMSERRKDKDGKGLKEDTSDNNSVVSAGPSSGSGVDRGVKPKNQE